MAKSDLLKQAIADARAVKETALANAKLALQEAFAPRLENMLQSKLIGEIEGEDDVDVNMDLDAEAGMDAEAPIDGEMGGEEDFNWTDDTLAANVGGQDYSFQVGMAGEDEEDLGDEFGAEPGMEDAMGDEMPAEDDLNLEEILRELEMPADGEPVDDYDEDVDEDGFPRVMDGGRPSGSSREVDDYDENEEDINEIIEAILRETDMGMEPPVGNEEDITALKTENEELEKNLDEAYRTVKHLNSVINEVNLLNAKLLYTNKLFRNFDLNEGQKMKVIENFDRAVSPREAKLVFATLAESFTKPTQKRAMVKESAASRATRTTAPSKETTQILSEGFELANRWKKLAGLI
jgi:hypothetical protein